MKQISLESLIHDDTEGGVGGFGDGIRLEDT